MAILSPHWLFKLSLIRLYFQELWSCVSDTKTHLSCGWWPPSKLSPDTQSQAHWPTRGAPPLLVPLSGTLSA